MRFADVTFSMILREPAIEVHSLKLDNAMERIRAKWSVRRERSSADLGRLP